MAWDGPCPFARLRGNTEGPTARLYVLLDTENLGGLTSEALCCQRARVVSWSSKFPRIRCDAAIGLLEPGRECPRI